MVNSKISKIGFSNFRKFSEFPEIDLGDVTVLVGTNNSGKSTLIKALLLCYENLINPSIKRNSRKFYMRPYFYFGANNTYDLKIKTFERALHKNLFSIARVAPDDEKTKDEEQPSAITFKFTVGQFSFTYVIAKINDILSGTSRDDESCGEVLFLSVEDMKNNIRYSANFEEYGFVGCTILQDYNEHDSDINDLYKRYLEENEKLISAKEMFDVYGNVDKLAKDEYETYLRHVNEIIKQLRDYLKDEIDLMVSDEELIEYVRENIINVHRTTVKKSFELDNANWLAFSCFNSIQNLLDDVFGFWCACATHNYEVFNRIDILDVSSKIIQNISNIDLTTEAGLLQQSYKDWKCLLPDLHVYYIPTHAVNHNTIYNVQDKSDYIAETVHEYVRVTRDKEDYHHENVQQYMQDFGIGDDYKIITIEDGIYQVKIIDRFGTEMSLADKGVGAIQLMTLFLKLQRIACEHDGLALSSYGIECFEEKSPCEVLVVLEEPEQNLHPKFQSKLLEVLKWYHARGIHFIIETHSEYLIRKSQVYINEASYLTNAELKEKTPFKVYYFPENGGLPYEMEYRKDGCFANDFGEGFFDEAENLAFKIL